ncbi:MAG: YhcH/YjgK/YiaL family protein [Clostridia bacterium]|nr:YhcH/YjgK/YiaL family protein [Clostridia bacterium]
MIYDKVENISNYGSKHSNLQKAFESIASGAYLNFETGRNTIDGDNLYATKVKLELKDSDAGVFEAHQAYVDIHIPLVNSEDMGLSFVDDLTITSDYDANVDYLLGNSEKSIDVTLSEGQFIVLFPQDAHKVGVSKSKIGQAYEKVIYKVRL